MRKRRKYHQTRIWIVTIAALLILVCSSGLFVVMSAGLWPAGFGGLENDSVSKRLWPNWKDVLSSGIPGMSEISMPQPVIIKNDSKSQNTLRNVVIFLSNIDIDDLISAGVIGLMDAIEKYDPSRDNKFKTYAEFRIRGAILDELRSQDWVPRSVRDKAKKIERTYAELEQKLGRAVTDTELSESLGLPLDEYYSMVSNVKSISLLLNLTKII